MTTFNRAAFSGAVSATTRAILIALAAIGVVSWTDEAQVAVAVAISSAVDLALLAWIYASGKKANGEDSDSQSAEG